MTVVEDVPGRPGSGTAAAPTARAPGVAPAASAATPAAPAPTTAPSPPPTTAPPPPTTAPPTVITQPGTYTTSAGPAGSVIVAFDGSTLAAQPIPAAGWTAYSELLSGPDVKIEYRSDDQRKVEWRAEVEGGVLRVTWKVD
jgi:hypothetical protein